MDWQAVQQVGVPTVFALSLLAWLIRHYEKQAEQTLDLLRESIRLQESATANQKRTLSLLARLLREMGVEVVGEET